MPQGSQRGLPSGRGQALWIQNICSRDRYTGTNRGHHAGSAGQKTRSRRRVNVDGVELDGAAFAGGGVFLSLQAQGIHDDLSDEIGAASPPPDSRDPRFQRGKIFTVSADAAYALATVTLLTAVYYTLRDKGPPSRGTIDVRAVALEPVLNPQVGPGYAGLGMEWRW